MALALAGAACGGTTQRTATRSSTTTGAAATTTTTVAPAKATSSTTSSTPRSAGTSTTTSAGATSSSTTGTGTAGTGAAGTGAGGGAVPAGFDPVSFTAISAKQFWLLGDAPCSNPVCTSIVRTTDGGSTFVGIPAPAATLALNTSTSTAAGINTLRFADAQDGYAYATGPEGQLWDTHDGGAHWSEPLALSGQELLAFGTGDGYAFALVGTCPNGTCSKLAMERTPVGNDNWTDLSVPVPSGADQVATMTVHGPDLWFSVTTSTSQSNQLLVASTNDANSFTTYQSPCSPGLAGTIQASSADVLWAVCPTGMMAQASRSDDGGAHWSALNTGELPNSAQLAPASDTTAVLVTSGGGPLMQTTDGGKTWQDISGTTASNGYSWDWVGFTDGQTGSALQETGTLPANWPWQHGPFPEQLWRTSDGGSTWTGPVKI